MPYRALRPCARPGCGALVTAGLCAAHRKPSYGPSWPSDSAGFLAAHPRCVDCGRPATESDHAPESREELLARGVKDPDRWQYLQARCKPCHSRRTRLSEPRDRPTRKDRR